MKKLILLILITFTIFDANAKKVKFAVDMRDQTVNATGVHVSGDFQTLAGFSGGDWMPNTTTMTQEKDTNIYSIVVDLPAFAKYEYKFLNGDQWYDSEFVPLESRVGYNGNDNRWIWVDSLKDDTSFAGAIKFGANALNGLYLVRFLVNMQNETLADAKVVHLAGSFGNWDTKTICLNNLDSRVYEGIIYQTAGKYEYKFVNGNTDAAMETVPAECAENGKRTVDVTADIVLASVCYSKCIDCVTSCESEEIENGKYPVLPNPAENYFSVKLEENAIFDILVTDEMGKVVEFLGNYSQSQLRIDCSNYDSGVYFLKIRKNGNNTASVVKLLVN
jgi:alpha-amylase